MSCAELGTCPVCGAKDVPLMRQTIEYPLECDCHNGNHVDVVYHCSNCSPPQILFTKISMSPSRVMKLANLVNENKALKAKIEKLECELACAKEDIESCMHYCDDKNNNVCSFCEHDCEVSPSGSCAGRDNNTLCSPKYRGPRCETPSDFDRSGCERQSEE